MIIEVVLDDGRNIQVHTCSDEWLRYAIKVGSDIIDLYDIYSHTTYFIKTEHIVTIKTRE